jgi:hypothetical protein
MLTKDAVSPEKTTTLGISNLLALATEGDDKNYYVVHKRYFKNTKSVCPACGSDKTRCSKVVRRKLKDIIFKDSKSFKIIDLIFYQRYLRCDACKDSVFPEDIDFALKGCRYTNRLSDKLAEGTLRFSYQKVCAYYGVPASTASVGAIMRRHTRYKESLLDPIKTPKIICVIEVDFYGEMHPVVLAILNNEVYCLDILENNDEETYISFFRSLDGNNIETVCVEPEESLISAVANCFPMASVVITGECFTRYARNAMINIIHSDGKRFPVKHKNDYLTRHEKHLPDRRTRRQIETGMKSRPRLKKAYDHHQKLLEIMESKWSFEQLKTWVNELPDEFDEFADIIDLIDIYGTELKAYLEQDISLPRNYTTSVRAICDAFNEMPKCIFDVLRARSILAPVFDTVEEDGVKMRQGIRVDRLTANMNEISNNIKEEREYGLER